MQKTMEALPAATEVSFDVPETFFQAQIDPIVLSCAMYRLGKTNPQFRHLSFQDIDSWRKEISSEDYDMANAVRKDFIRKLTWWMIAKGEFTPFKQALYDFLNVPLVFPMGISSKILGMLYKLPYFYTYNKEQRELFEFDNLTITGYPVFKGEKTLSFIKALSSSRKKDKTKHEYWFNDEHGNKVVLELATNNQLAGLFEIHVKSKSIRVSGEYRARDNFGAEYYVATNNWTIVE